METVGSWGQALVFNFFLNILESTPVGSTAAELRAFFFPAEGYNLYGCCITSLSLGKTMYETTRFPYYTISMFLLNYVS